MNEIKKIKISSFGNEKESFFLELFLLLICVIALLSYSKKIGIPLFFIGFIIIVIYLFFIIFKAKRIVSLYKDCNDNYYIRKFFPINKKIFIPVEFIYIKKYLFFKVFKLKVEIGSRKETFYTYSYKSNDNEA